MSKTVLITGELRNWKKKDVCGMISYTGKMYKDMHGIYLDGEEREILPAAVKSVSEYADYYLLRTYGWNLKLEKSQEKRR